MKLNKFNVIAALLAAVVLWGCKNEDVSRQHYDNKLFISASAFTDEMLIKGTVHSYERQITAGIAKPAAEDITVEFAAAPELLGHYRQAFYDPDVLLLSAEHYLLEEPQTMIQAGSVTSAPVRIEFVDVNLLDKDERYVLPVTIRSVQGIGGVLGSARTLYFLFKGAALINVVADIADNRAWPEWDDPSPVTDMTTFTLEAMIYGNAFKNQISTIMGIEGQFLVRIGDAGVDPDQIQVAALKNLTNADLKLESRRWYHLAVTFNAGDVAVYLDGVEKCKGNVGTRSVNFGVAHSDESANKPRCFWIGYSYDKDRYLDGRISEVRIWNKALSVAQINAPDHFYRVEPTADGLVAYWKFDEGAGKTVKDHTSYGNDLTLENDPKWIAVALPQTEK